MSRFQFMQMVLVPFTFADEDLLTLTQARDTLRTSYSELDRLILAGRLTLVYDEAAAKHQGKRKVLRRDVESLAAERGLATSPTHPPVTAPAGCGDGSASGGEDEMLAVTMEGTPCQP